jgi:hypothetical protein
VVLNNANTSLTADNVQGAFEETQPKLSEIIVGEWDVKAYVSRIGEEAKIETGTITFNADGTFSFTEAGQNFASDLLFKYGIANPIKYQIYNDSLIGISCERENIKTSNVRDFTTITTDKLVSKIKTGSFDSVYVLTRKQ